MKRYEVVVYELAHWPDDTKRREWRAEFVGGVLITSERELGCLEAFELAAGAELPGVDAPDPRAWSA